MPLNKTASPLKDKYGELRVARARNLIKAQMGIALNSYRKDDHLPWGTIGKIAMLSKKAGKMISANDVIQAKKDYKKYGVDKSMKKDRKLWEKGKPNYNIK